MVGGAAVGLGGLLGARRVSAQADGSGELGDLGDACSEVLPCQTELVCANGVCAEPDDDDDDDDKSPTLPNTGSGATAGPGGTGGNSWLTPAALAGAAAFLASQLRGTTEAKEKAD